jgi:hypothetical protein
MVHEGLRKVLKIAGGRFCEGVSEYGNLSLFIIGTILSEVVLVQHLEREHRKTAERQTQGRVQRNGRLPVIVVFSHHLPGAWLGNPARGIGS